MRNVAASRIIGIGIGPMNPVPMKRNTCGRPVIDRPCVYVSASPRAITSMPSVVIKGGMCSLVMITPFTRPSTPPTASPATNASGTGTSDWSRLAVMTVERASTEPTERSMPPVRITYVMPMAMMPLIAD